MRLTRFTKGSSANWYCSQEGGACGLRSDCMRNALANCRNTIFAGGFRGRKRERQGCQSVSAWHASGAKQGASHRVSSSRSPVAGVKQGIHFSFSSFLLFLARHPVSSSLRLCLQSLARDGAPRLSFHVHTLTQTDRQTHRIHWQRHLILLHASSG